MRRQIRKVFRSKPTIEGAGVHLARAFGFDEVEQFDPFLLLDDFRGNDPAHYLPGFPWHPHRGIETITYVLAGRVEHGDSLGNAGVIGEGDVQWMTAGGGIIHQEMPKGRSDGVMGGFQLWANLPAADKMMAPRYRGITREVIPEVVQEGGVRVKVVAGRIGDVHGPVEGVVIEPEYLDVSVPAGAAFSHPVTPGHTALAYVIEGRGYFDERRDPYAFEAEGANYFDLTRDCLLGSAHLVLFDDGDAVVVQAADDTPVRFLFFAGRPLREPIAWYGPIVMNTQEELRTAFEDLRRGTFLRSST